MWILGLKGLINKWMLTLEKTILTREKTRLTSPEVCAGQPQRLYSYGSRTAAWKQSCFSQGINANQELQNF